MDYSLLKRKSVRGLYYFVLQHKSGLIIMRSEDYTSRAALDAITKTISQLMPGITVSNHSSLKTKKNEK